LYAKVIQTENKEKRTKRKDIGEAESEESHLFSFLYSLFKDVLKVNCP